MQAEKKGGFLVVVLMTDDVVFSYSSEQATEDGMLFDLLQLNPDWKAGLFRYVTSNLMDKGYLLQDKVNVASVYDLLRQCLHIVKEKSNNFKDFDTFFSGIIELPSGEKQKVFIGQNETGKFTIMLPEDW